ncbi:hypothetical protein HELRODRAFT_174128 [Helobdella robusta]|uniref:Uncharacterized protein n=1 Tax=Helobdella robusta TaxID=6412 RepID=T1F7N7_HELRO|nr:hypothetical protein HELRODRAFT_174128 [Helobdella robusta]ESO03228.1 hypothetical protein HELRODRAFT_174128 [Helobdella robusta]
MCVCVVCVHSQWDSPLWSSYSAWDNSLDVRCFCTGLKLTIDDEGDRMMMMGLVAEWLACLSTTSTTRVRILQFLQVHPGSRLPVNPAVHPFEVGKWVDDVSCRMLAGEMAQWFECAIGKCKHDSDDDDDCGYDYDYDNPGNDD